MASVTEYNNIDYKAVSFSKLKKRDGKYTSYIQYNKNPMYLQSPKLKLLGIEREETVEDSESPPQQYILFEVPSNSKFHAFCQEFEENNINVVSRKSEKWFNGRQLPLEFIQKGYKSLLQETEGDIENGEAPSLICRVPFKPFTSRKNPTGVYNQNRKTAKVSDLRKGRSMVAILEPYCIQIGRRTIRCNWRIVQIEVKVPRPSLKGFSIKQYSDDESDDYPSPDEDSDDTSDEDSEESDGDSEYSDEENLYSDGEAEEVKIEENEVRREEYEYDDDSSQSNGEHIDEELREDQLSKDNETEQLEGEELSEGLEGEELSGGLEGEELSGGLEGEEELSEQLDEEELSEEKEDIGVDEVSETALSSEGNETKENGENEEVDLVEIKTIKIN